MSNLNIKRAVENIRSNTTVYTPIVEVLVNSIQAIEQRGASNGEITIRIRRVDQAEIDGTLADVRSFIVEDNGIGFTLENRDSFDTLYSDQKVSEGGKGFGRFTCLKYFEDLHVESTYQVGERFEKRTFLMGKDRDLIVGEKVGPSPDLSTKTTITLRDLIQGKSIDKKLDTIARNLVEKLLAYFITADYMCPRILLSEFDGSSAICLNDFFRNELSGVIKEIFVADSTFQLKSVIQEEAFLVRVFKLYYPKNQKSKISLVAHKREVTGSAIQKFVPEFSEDFYDKDADGENNRERNYIVKAYVFGPYLDRNVSLEHGGFEFKADNDLLLGISETDIETKAAAIAQAAVGSDIALRQARKQERIQNYVDEQAPWHKEILDTIDLKSMPFNPSDAEIESHLQREKFSQEVQIKREVTALLAEPNLARLKENVLDVVSKISGTSKYELIHYIALRRNILDIFEKSLQVDESGAYASEGVVHDIIFPRKGDTDRTSFHEHNLWIIDERLNFTNFVSSDLPLNGAKSDRPDLLVYNNRVVFRGDNLVGNPVTIFEFKKPQRDDFVNPSSNEDPVQQIVRYVNSIRAGKFNTPQGRKMLVAENTPFYGYVVCDLSTKVETWLRQEKNFKPMPDRLGWFQWYENINLYIEVLSWDKVLNDAKMRNKIFFKKLGI